MYAAAKPNMADFGVIFDSYFPPVLHNISDRIDLLQSAIDWQTCDLSHLEPRMQDVSNRSQTISIGSLLTPAPTPSVTRSK